MSATEEQVDELRRVIEKLVADAVMYCHQAYVQDGRLELHGGRADEHRRKLEPYNEVKDVGGKSPAAFFYAKLFPPFGVASKTLDDLLDRLRRGEGDIIYSVGESLEGLECGPGLISVVGAPPGAGKTALTMQFAFELLEADDDQRVLIANAEMPFDVLLKRELSRRSGVPSKALRFANLTPRQLQGVEAAATELKPLVERIDVMDPPFTIDRLSEYADSTPGLLVLDYLQKFAPGDDPGVGVNEVMGVLRFLAHGGWGVLALSSTTRGKNGHVSADLSMASFKESGEIEFNADSLYLLRDQGAVDEADHRIRNVLLDCVKNRHGERESIELVFDMPAMTFGRPEPDVTPCEELSEYEGNPFAEAAP